MFDLIIVGGGMVGAGLACALASSQLKIGLIDERVPKSHDARLFALSKTSCQLLKNLCLWDALATEATPIERIHISQKGHFGALRFAAKDLGFTHLGYMIPASLIEQALNQRLTEITRLHLFRPAKLLRARYDVASSSHQLTIKSEQSTETISCRFLIGADGTHSLIRDAYSTQIDKFDYHQSALVTQLEIELPHQHQAYERFTQQGTLAMLPLKNNRVALIWTGDSAFINKLNNYDEPRFLQAVYENFGYRLGAVKLAAKKSIYPLTFVATNNLFTAGCLIGNAAHTLNPIAAQGFNLALLEVAVIAEAILKHKSIEFLPLAEKIKTLQRQQHFRIQFSHKLAKLSASKSHLLSQLFQVGLVSMDALPSLKNTFIKTVLGLTHGLPPLLRDSR